MKICREDWQLSCQTVWQVRASLTGFENVQRTVVSCKKLSKRAMAAEFEAIDRFKNVCVSSLVIWTNHNDLFLLKWTQTGLFLVSPFTKLNDKCNVCNLTIGNRVDSLHGIRTKDGRWIHWVTDAPSYSCFNLRSFQTQFNKSKLIFINLVLGTGIWTCDLLFTSRLLKPLDHGSHSLVASYF